jgi:hypothetical protein
LSIPVFSPGSEWLLPTESEPVAPTADPPAAALAAALAPAEVAADAAALLLGLDDEVEQAARRLGTAASPATPAIPPRTRRLVTTGLAGDGSAAVRGVSAFAMISSS